MIFSLVQPLVKYSFSKFKKPITFSSTLSGTGNQNILVKSEKIDIEIIENDFKYAPTTIGIINIGLIYQLKIFWCLSNAQ